MLTRIARGLERDRLISRTVHPTVPPKVEYTLTEVGHTLLDTVQALEQWARAHRQDVVAARARYDAAEHSGYPMQALVAADFQ